MKIAPLLVASATALETSTSATALLAAVGKRNVTHMESLIQGLVEESIKTPAWKFDKDIQDALDAIRNMFVKSIQTALMEQHEEDQVAHNEGTYTCFKKCKDQYHDDDDNCEKMTHECHKIRDEHVTCRTKVFDLYKDMAKKCGKLHCFDPPKIECEFKTCICPDLLNCHYGHKIDETAYDAGTGVKTDTLWCDPKAGECTSTWGTWLGGVIKKYESAHAQWYTLWEECSDAYRVFLYADVECDGTQRSFEKCMCEKSFWKSSICENDLKQCQNACNKKYEEEVTKLQCIEKDRKIDWSATKKIECYMDILLHVYTEKELLEKCGSKDCVNVQREKDYKHCATICQRVDYDGEWGSPTCTEDVAALTPGHVYFAKGAGHEPRHEDGQYRLGDKHYKLDLNGPHVHTDHRSFTTTRKDENRCTEHLDIDFQIPPHIPCIPINKTVCDDHWHCEYYEQFDKTAKIGCIHDCCPEDGGHCFDKVTLTSCDAKACDETGRNCGDSDGAYDEVSYHPSTNYIKFAEHTYAWAYNRCECHPCTNSMPSYPDPPGGPKGWCWGVHTLISHDAYGL